MKKILAAALLFIIAFSLAGCAESSESAKSASISMDNSSEAVRKGQKSEEKEVSIIVPESAYNICKKYIAENDFCLQTPTKDETGYVYKIRSCDKKTVLGGIKKQVLDDLNALTEKWPGVETIEVDADFSHITLLCEGSFKDDKKLSEKAYLYIMTYRAFSGMETDGFTLGFSALDSESFEALGEYVYPEKPAAAPSISPTPENTENTGT